jgi:hypothetical protein
VQKVIPEIVSQGEDGYLSIEYGKMAPLLVEAIKAQQAEIEKSKAENDRLQAENEKLKAGILQISDRLEKVEKLVNLR